MSLPAPEPGLVIRFNYLWTHEAARGRDNARYPRPCVVVLALRRTEGGETVVLVAPVTHLAPDRPAEAIAIPVRVKQALGLDAPESWIIAGEVNEFTWPGHDLAPDDRGRVDIGFLPPRLFDAVREKVLSLATEGRLGRVPR
jgi:hypothetical protein